MKKIALLLVLTALFYQCKTSKLDQENTSTVGIDSTTINPLSQQPKSVEILFP